MLDLQGFNLRGEVRLNSLVKIYITFCCDKYQPGHVSYSHSTIFVYGLVLEFDFSPDEIKFIIESEWLLELFDQSRAVVYNYRIYPDWVHKWLQIEDEFFYAIKKIRKK